MFSLYAHYRDRCFSSSAHCHNLLIAIVKPLWCKIPVRFLLQAFMVWRLPSQSFDMKRAALAKNCGYRDLTETVFDQLLKDQFRSTYQSDYLGIPQGKAADACRLKIKGECLSVKQCACFNERGATHVANSLGPHYLTLLC